MLCSEYIISHDKFGYINMCTKKKKIPRINKNLIGSILSLKDIFYYVWCVCIYVCVCETMHVYVCIHAYMHLYTDEPVCL